MENELQIEKTYPYRDEEGNVKFVIGRFVDGDGNKTFKVASCDQNGKLNDWGLGGQEPILYNLPELIKSSGMVFIVEGEKDVDRLTEIGLTATTNPFGAGKWRDEFGQYLIDRDVVIIPDNDKVGKEHAMTVFKNLSNKADRSAYLNCQI